MTNAGFDPQLLSTAYDRGRLVPFIGAGMSMPSCVSWEEFVCNLEKNCPDSEPSLHGDLIQRAYFSVQCLRLSGEDFAQAIETAVYRERTTRKGVPCQTRILARLYWPLICTTNYDDIYVRAVAKSGSNRKLRVVGRSDAHCRDLLQHLSFPVEEFLWTVQGFLHPKDREALCALKQPDDIHQLANELIVGHAEYRKVAHRESHFRRCFAEVFRRFSLLFLGSSLTDPYFLALFDEIIELTGPPARPHFAIVEDENVDADLMHQRYHINCITYPAGQHDYVAWYLEEFCCFVESERVRPSSWGVRVLSPKIVRKVDTGDSFKVVRGVLPDYRTEVPEDHGVAVSCGRTEVTEGSDPCGRGQPLLGAGSHVIPRNCTWEWLGGYWTVQFSERAKKYGIVARALLTGENAPDSRSPKVIRDSFLNSLEVISRQGVRTLHVQLLAAGPGKVFHPWLSLVQMARGYGQWVRDRSNSGDGEPMQVVLYVVDPSVIGLLSGSFVDLVEQVECTQLRIDVELIHGSNDRDQFHRFISADAGLQELVGERLRRIVGKPLLYARPTPTFDFAPQPFDDVKCTTAEEFGLVHGSTLVVDCRG